MSKTIYKTRRAYRTIAAFILAFFGFFLSFDSHGTGDASLFIPRAHADVPGGDNWGDGGDGGGGGNTGGGSPGGPGGNYGGFSADADYQFEASVYGPASDGGGGDGWVICTQLASTGEMDPELYEVSAAFALQLNPVVLRGYHSWAVPYVRLMRKNCFFTKIAAPIAHRRALDIAHRINPTKYPHAPLSGRIIRLIGEPCCWAVGLFVKDTNWRSLYLDDTKYATKQIARHA